MRIIKIEFVPKNENFEKRIFRFSDDCNVIEDYISNIINTLSGTVHGKDVVDIYDIIVSSKPTQKSPVDEILDLIEDDVSLVSIL